MIKAIAEETAPSVAAWRILEKPLLYVAVFAVIALALQLVQGRYEAHLLNTMLIYGVAAMGVNIIMGYAGLVSMGHAAQMAIGAYGAVLLQTTYGWPFLLSLSVGALIASGMSALVGVLGSRVGINYFLLVTAGLHQVVILVIINEEHVTNGASGIRNLPTPSLFGLSLDTNRSFGYFLASVVVLGLYTADRLKLSKPGRAMLAAQQRPVVALASGVNVAKHQILAMALGGAYLGIAGALLSYLLGFLGPDIFTLALTLQLLLVVVVGGVGSNLGAISGAVALVYVTEQFRAYEAVGNLAYGVLIMVLLITIPIGIAGTLTRLRQRFLAVLVHTKVVVSATGGISRLEPEAEGGDGTENWHRDH